MQTVRMVTTAPHAYAGHALRAGEEYDCEAQHVAHMEKLGWARQKAAPQSIELPGQAGHTAQTYATRDMQAAARNGVNSGAASAASKSTKKGAK